MRDGLRVIKLPGYYGLTRVGWLRRVHGDEYVLLPGARTVWRESGSRLLEDLADDGPLKDHGLGKPSKGNDEIHRLLVWRCLPADVAAWAKACPMPKGWVAE
ncbi:MAG: hypothetical protein H0U52_16270 [Chloroflexi bacterium]|nr:hypothetical protein [Chloroflexota bacterium]